MIKKTILPVVLATIWISISEFVRNEFILKSYWTDHYEGMGLIFPSEPINGAVWGIWSLCFAIGIYIISQKFSLVQTTLLSWFVGFRAYVACNRQYERTTIWDTTICHSVKHPGSIWGCIHHHENDEQVKMNAIIVHQK
jgi:hypothetical protein